MLKIKMIFYKKKKKKTFVQIYADKVIYDKIILLII